MSLWVSLLQLLIVYRQALDNLKNYCLTPFSARVTETAAQLLAIDRNFTYT